VHAGELLVFVKLGFAPVEHSSHSRSVVALGSLDILDPGAHILCKAQNVCPLAGWYAFGSHCLQCPTEDWATLVSPYMPASHSVHAELPSALHDPSGQLLHPGCCSASWYCPAGQPTHAT
jgi:hypothetical protein